MSSKAYSMGPGGLSEITDQAPGEADRRCPMCGEVGYPDSRINERLWYCEGCRSAYFLRIEGK